MSSFSSSRDPSADKLAARDSIVFRFFSFYVSVSLPVGTAATESIGGAKFSSLSSSLAVSLSFDSLSLSFFYSLSDFSSSSYSLFFYIISFILAVSMSFVYNAVLSFGGVSSSPSCKSSSLAAFKAALVSSTSLALFCSSFYFLTSSSSLLGPASS